MKKYTIKILGIKSYNTEKIKDFINFESSYLKRENKHKILLIHYLLYYFNKDNEYFTKLEKLGYEIYTIDPQDIGGENDTYIKENSKEYNIRLAVEI